MKIFSFLFVFSCIKEEKKREDPNIIPLEIFAKDVGNCDYVRSDSYVLFR